MPSVRIFFLTLAAELLTLMKMTRILYIPQSQEITTFQMPSMIYRLSIYVHLALLMLLSMRKLQNLKLIQLMINNARRFRARIDGRLTHNVAQRSDVKIVRQYEPTSAARQDNVICIIEVSNVMVPGRTGLPLRPFSRGWSNDQPRQQHIYLIICCYMTTNLVSASYDFYFVNQLIIFIFAI